MPEPHRQLGPVTVLLAHQEDTTLGEALAWADPGLGADPIAILSNPMECRFGRVARDAVTGAGGRPLALAGVFEARAFGPTAELRWVATGEGRGTAVLVTDSDAPGAPTDRDLPGYTGCSKVAGQYLLWGSGHQEAAGGWTRLASSRVGPLEVPLAFSPNDQRRRACIQAIEYQQIVDRHGNVAVVEERLAGLAWTQWKERE